MAAHSARVAKMRACAEPWRRCRCLELAPRLVQPCASMIGLLRTLTLACLSRHSTDDILQTPQGLKHTASLAARGSVSISSFLFYVGSLGDVGLASLLV